jgi:hypothetical protein
LLYKAPITLLAQYAMYQSQALHFVRKLLVHFQPQRSGSSDQVADFFQSFHEAIKLGLTWHSISDDSWDTDKVNHHQHDNPLSSFSWNGGNAFDSSRLGITLNYPVQESQSKNHVGWLQVLLTLCPDALKVRDPTFGLFPFQLAALPQKRRIDCHSSDHANDPNSTLDRIQVNTIYNLLLSCPDVVKA